MTVEAGTTTIAANWNMKGLITPPPRWGSVYKSISAQQWPQQNLSGWVFPMWYEVWYNCKCRNFFPYQEFNHNVIVITPPLHPSHGNMLLEVIVADCVLFSSSCSVQQLVFCSAAHTRTIQDSKILRQLANGMTTNLEIISITASEILLINVYILRIEASLFTLYQYAIIY